MRSRLASGPAPAGAAEAEALRRFRSFLLLALAQEEPAAPALEGLRTGERRTRRVIEAWLDAAAQEAGPDEAALRAALAPIAERFLGALRETAQARRASGAPVSGQRRAVSAAIDRVCDAFFAIDVETGAIADANPAAGALLGTTRDRLLGSDAMATYPRARARPGGRSSMPSAKAPSRGASAAPSRTAAAVRSPWTRRSRASPRARARWPSCSRVRDGKGTSPS
jgi:PAS domain-containing protein